VSFRAKRGISFGIILFGKYLPEDEYPLAQIVGALDDELCDLCAWLNGRIIQRGAPEWERYRLPSHINCRRAFAYIPADLRCPVA
jgi:hypothetical protein